MFIYYVYLLCLFIMSRSYEEVLCQALMLTFYVNSLRIIQPPLCKHFMSTEKVKRKSKQKIL